MNRRGFFKALGAGAALTAAGLLVPSTRKIFLPPAGGWTGYYTGPLNPGDVLQIRRCSQLLLIEVYGAGGGGGFDYRPTTRYDAVWTMPDGEERQYTVDMTSAPGEDQRILDTLARDQLQKKMRADGGTPGAKYFKLELPRDPLYKARYIA